MGAIIHQSNNIYEYEIPTIMTLREYCINNDCNVLYFHTKGISLTKYNTSQYNMPYKILMNNVSMWRDFMEDHLIDNWRKCIGVLNTTISDTAGVNYAEIPIKHYAGNFWWAKSDYIKKLPDITGTPERIIAEMWIGLLPQAIMHNMSNKTCGYFQPIDKKDY